MATCLNPVASRRGDGETKRTCLTQKRRPLPSEAKAGEPLVDSSTHVVLHYTKPLRIFWGCRQLEWLFRLVNQQALHALVAPSRRKVGLATQGTIQFGKFGHVFPQTRLAQSMRLR